MSSCCSKELYLFDKWIWPSRWFHTLNLSQHNGSFLINFVVPVLFFGLLNPWIREIFWDGNTFCEVVSDDNDVVFESWFDVSLDRIWDIKPHAVELSSESLVCPFSFKLSRPDINFLHISWVHKKLTPGLERFVLFHHHLFFRANWTRRILFPLPRAYLRLLQFLMVLISIQLSLCWDSINFR